MTGDDKMREIKTKRIALFFGLFTLFLSGCGNQSDFQEKQAAPSLPLSVGNMAGSWKGTATSAVDNKTSAVTLTLIQPRTDASPGTEFSGSYDCVNGAVACPLTKGIVTANISQLNFTGGVAFPTILPTAPSCSFHGNVAGDIMTAQYSCDALAGGDQGHWSLTRQQ